MADKRTYRVIKTFVDLPRRYMPGEVVELRVGTLSMEWVARGLIEPCEPKKVEKVVAEVEAKPKPRRTRGRTK